MEEWWESDYTGEPMTPEEIEEENAKCAILEAEYKLRHMYDEPIVD